MADRLGQDLLKILRVLDRNDQVVLVVEDDGRGEPGNLRSNLGGQESEKIGEGDGLDLLGE